MTSAPIALVTSANAREMSTEDDVLLDALGVLGVPCELVNWDDPDYDWRRPSLVLLRTVWDYHRRLAEFSAWVDLIEAKNELLNPPDLVRWNWDKRYLLELEANGVPVVQTRLIQTAEEARALEVPVATVIKPAIAAGAYETLVFEPEQAESARAHAEKLLNHSSVLIQPYLNGIEVEGETSLVYFDGEFHHAVRKTPKKGDFRVQVEFGGHYEVVEPTEAQLAVGELILDAVPDLPLYARLDLVGGPDQPLLMEAEMIEPELFFLWVPAAAVLMADLLGERRREKLTL